MTQCENACLVQGIYYCCCLLSIGRYLLTAPELNLGPDYLLLAFDKQCLKFISPIGGDLRPEDLSEREQGR